MAGARLSAMLHWPAFCFALFSLIAFKYAKVWLISRNQEQKSSATPFLTHLLGLPSRQRWHSSDWGSLYSEDATEACADAPHVLPVREAAVGGWEEIIFFNVTFQHFKSMYVPLLFESIIALKLIKRVGSKAVPEVFEELAAECSLAIPISCQVIPLIPESFEISLARKFRSVWTTSLFWISSQVAALANNLIHSNGPSKLNRIGKHLGAYEVTWKILKYAWNLILFSSKTAVQI